MLFSQCYIQSDVQPSPMWQVAAFKSSTTGPKPCSTYHTKIKYIRGMGGMGKGEVVKKSGTEREIFITIQRKYFTNMLHLSYICFTS